MDGGSKGGLCGNLMDRGLRTKGRLSTSCGNFF